MGKWYFIWNETRDAQYSMGKKSVYNLEQDILAVLMLGWSFTEHWSIVNDEDHEVDPAKIVKTDR